MLNGKLKSVTYRAISVLLSVIMLFSVFDLGVLTSVADSADGGFVVKLKWNGTGQDPDNYDYYSDSSESRLVRLKVLYENKEVSSGYQPGEIVITVPGLKDAVRSGTSYIPAAIAADKASSTSKIYDWSYTYSSTSDTFTFTNNVAISANSTFEGSFEIIWNLPSRQTKDGFSEALQAKLRTAKNDQAVSNEVYYTQTRVRDVYTLSNGGASLTSALSSAEGLLGLLPDDKEEEDYVWVKYDVRGTDTYYARDVQGSERFECWFLEGALVNGEGLTKTGETKVIDGKTYECWTTSKNVTAGTSSFLSSVYVAYPKDLYEDQNASVYVDLYGTYYEETEETLLAQTEIIINLKNFDFIDIPGNIYDNDKISYGVHSSYINSHCGECSSYGAVNSQHLSNGSTEYYSVLGLDLNYDKDNVNSYDLEFVDDIMDITTTSGELRRLNDDEFNFTEVVIPSAKSVININRFTIEPDVYTVEIYIRRAGEEFETDPYETTMITNAYQYIALPDDTVAVKVLFKDMQESLRSLNIKLYYKFHTSAEDILLNNGNVVNYMYFKLYDDKGNWVNDSFGRDTYPSDELYDRDMELYGHSFDREIARLHIVELPNEYSSTTSLTLSSEGKEAYYFTGGINDSFNIAEGNTLSNFSVYTILPENMKLQSLYSTPDALYNALTFSSSGYSSAYIKEHATVEIIENYKDSGRTYIAVHYDFSDSPITPSNISIQGIPLCYERDYLKKLTNSFTLRSVTLIDQDGKWYATSTDNSGIDSGLWRDIDGDGDVSEVASQSTATVTMYNPESSNLQFIKSVRTTLSNGYVQPSFDTTNSQYVEDELPYTYKNYEYSYKLRLKTGESLANHIVFVDSLETGERAEWQGTFVRVDTSYAENLLGVKPTVYFSSKETDATQIPDFNSSDWTTTKPENVKSIAVDFGDAMLSSGSSLYIEIYMKAPDDADGSLEYKLTENFAHVHYDKYDVNTKHFIESQDIPSNNVPVSMTPFMGTIKIIKLDSTNQDKLSGAKFTLYEMLGDEPDTSVDTVITENLTTNSSGTASIKVPYGNYYVIETQAPIGYKINSEPQKIVLNAEEPDITVTSKIENERKEGQFTLRKVSDRNSNAYLQGAVFAVYSEDGKLVSENIVTDENGELTVSGLEWGNYYLQETKAPDGYLLSDEKISFTVHAENDAQDTATVKNEQIPATVILVKTEVLEDGTTKTGEPLDGAAYRLYDSNDKLLGTYMTDENGKIYVDDLTFGTYYFKESIAAQGYELYPEKITFTVDGNDLQKDKTVSKTVETTDTRLLGSLWLQKVDDVGDYVKNAEFALFRVSDDVQVDETGEESTKVFKTNAEGIIEITDLYWGEYYLKETKAPVGYELSDTKYPVTIDRTTVNKTIIINAVNNRGKGSVELTKVSEEDNTITLQGAVYTLYKNDGTVYRDDLVTDENGIITVKDIEWGSYYFLEKTPPENYGLSDEKIRFSVNYLTSGKVQKLTAADPPITCQLAATKRIKISDIVYAHGSPTFTFRLDGTDTFGNTYTYYKNVVFNEDFVNSYATANPDAVYVEQSVIFTDLPVGTWTVSEVDTVRYTLDKAEAITANGTVNGDTVVFKLDEDNSEGAAKFTNGKTTQSSTTHTSLAVNIAKADRKLTAIVALWQGEETITSETLDRTKLDVYAIYDDGTQVKLSDDAYTLDNETFDETMQGDYTITATYSEGGKTFSDSFVLNLKIPAPFTWTVEDGAFEENGIKYDGTATITGYTGTSTVLSIPSSVKGIRTLVDYDSGTISYDDNGKIYKVVATTGVIVWPVVGADISKPLYGVSEVTKIIIPDTLEEIGGYSFYECDNLTEIVFAEDSHLKTIGYQAFYNSPISGKLTIPASVTSIDTRAFFDCDSITQLTFDENSNLKTIGSQAFCYCDLLSGSLEIPASVEIIEVYAFTSCPITSLTFEKDSMLTTICSRAFQYCDDISNSLEIPASVTSIGTYAFSDCNGLTGLAFEAESKLEVIDDYAFASCTGLTGQLEIPASVKSIGHGAFQSCSSLTGLAFEEESQLEVIEDYAFYYCTGLTGQLEIPASVTSIGSYAFYYCTGLTGLTFEAESNLEVIEDFAFCSCTGLTGQLEIPAAVTSIGNSAFYRCTSLTELIFENDSHLKTIGEYAFSGCRSLAGELRIPKSVITIEPFAFGNRQSNYVCSKLTSLVFEEDSQLTTIGSYAFSGCKALAGELKIPKSVTTIDFYAFSTKMSGGNCSKITSIIFEEDSQLITIGSHAFYKCSGLQGTISIPASVTTIDNGAFSSCKSLTGVSFAENSQLKTIGDSAFSYCMSLEGELIIPKSVTSIGSYAFGASVYTYSCQNLTGVTFEEGSQLEEIGKGAFRYDFGLQGTITIPSTVKTVGDSAFSNCGSLTGIVFEENSNLTTIGASAFSGCTALTGEVTIPSTVTSIGDSAFLNCSSLTKLTFEENSNLTTIGTSAFSGCTALTGEVTIPSTVTSIGDSAFLSTAITKLYIPSTLTTTETYGLDSANVEYYAP